ncbi:MAG: aspartate aminotransferase family protein [Polyangiaceae bacterium]
MSDTEGLLDLAKRHLYANYKPAPFVLARGRGSELFDVDGKRYLDLAAGVAVCSVGHAHPTYVRAIAEQVAKVGHVSNYFYNEENIRLAVDLTTRSGMDRAFFCNSGAEANEAMLKCARHHFFGKGDTKRTRFVAFHNGFHGRTMGALSLTGTPKYREGFGGIEGVTHVAYGDVAAVRAAMGPDVAGIVVEPLQGEGGVLPAPAGFLKELRALADTHGALLLVDEVQTGIGRLGNFLATSLAGVKADAVSLAKGLGGGFPVGAMLTTEALAGALPPGTHGSTFGGNPLASVAARTVIRILDEENLIEGAKTKGALLGSLLEGIAKSLPELCEGARGEGLLRGLVLRPGYLARDVLTKLQESGVLLTAAGERVLRFTPPLVVTPAELQEGAERVKAALESLPAKAVPAPAPQAAPARP